MTIQHFKTMMELMDDIRSLSFNVAQKGREIEAKVKMVDRLSTEFKDLSTLRTDFQRRTREITEKINHIKTLFVKNGME